MKRSGRRKQQSPFPTAKFFGESKLEQLVVAAWLPRGKRTRAFQFGWITALSMLRREYIIDNTKEAMEFLGERGGRRVVSRIRREYKADNGPLRNYYSALRLPLQQRQEFLQGMEQLLRRMHNRHPLAWPYETETWEILKALSIVADQIERGDFESTGDVAEWVCHAVKGKSIERNYPTDDLRSAFIHRIQNILFRVGLRVTGRRSKEFRETPEWLKNTRYVVALIFYCHHSKRADLIRKHTPPSRLLWRIRSIQSNPL